MQLLLSFVRNECFNGHLSVRSLISEVTYQWGHLLVRLLISEVTYQWGHLSVRPLISKVTYQWGHLSVRSLISEVTYQWGHYQWGHLLVRSVISEITYQYTCQWTILHNAKAVVLFKNNKLWILLLVFFSRRWCFMVNDILT